MADAAPGLLRSAYLLTGGHADAEDLLQSALLRTLSRWQTIEGSPIAYAFRVLVNLSHDRWRSRRRWSSRAASEMVLEGPAADELERVLARDAIVAAARGLSRVQREVIACRFVLDLAVPETARALRLPEGTVKSHTARALALMRKALAETAGGTGDVSCEEVRRAQ